MNTSSASMRQQRGFTFLEVLIALGILVVGCVSVLSLFALGVNAQVRRRIDAREVQVRPEIETILQGAVESSREGSLPKPISDAALSQVGYALDVEWSSDPFGGPTPVAYAYLTYRGQRVKAIGPRPVPRLTLNPTAGGGGGGGN